MGRSTDTFPPYVRLEIDPNVWPPKYWSKARQCTECETNWPFVHLFSLSPCCGVETEIVEGSPDMRWPDSVVELLNFRFNRWYDEYNEGVSDDEIAWEDIKTKGEFDDAKIKDEVKQFLDQVI